MAVSPSTQQEPYPRPSHLQRRPRHPAHVAAARRFAPTFTHRRHNRTVHFILLVAPTGGRPARLARYTARALGRVRRPLLPHLRARCLQTAVEGGVVVCSALSLPPRVSGQMRDFKGRRHPPLATSSPPPPPPLLLLPPPPPEKRCVVSVTGTRVGRPFAVFKLREYEVSVPL
jgi:hypothetical protein